MATKTPEAVRVSASAETPPTAEKRAPHNFDFAGLPVEQLLSLRAQIDQRLPALELKDLDMEKELVRQFLAARQLQATILADTMTPANQKAQVSNSLAASLASLSKLQIVVHSSERMKRIEIALIDAVNMLPMEAKEAFLDAYAKILVAL